MCPEREVLTKCEEGEENRRKRRLRKCGMWATARKAKYYYEDNCAGVRKVKCQM